MTDDVAMFCRAGDTLGMISYYRLAKDKHKLTLSRTKVKKITTRIDGFLLVYSRWEKFDDETIKSNTDIMRKEGCILVGGPFLLDKDLAKKARGFIDQANATGGDIADIVGWDVACFDLDEYWRYLHSRRV